MLGDVPEGENKNILHAAKKIDVGNMTIPKTSSNTLASGSKMAGSSLHERKKEGSLMKLYID